MYWRDNFLVVPLFFVFMLHGVLYILYPDAQYLSRGASSGWIQYIKYLCLILMLLISVRERTPNFYQGWLYFGIGLVVVSTLLSSRWVSSPNLLLIQFQLALMAYFSAPFLIRFFSERRRTIWSLWLVFLTTAVTMAYEYLVGGVIQNFSSSGFRSTGIFVNPNNAGIMIAVVATGLHHLSRRLLVNVTIFMVAVACLLLSASKTGIMLYAIGLILVKGLKIKIFILAVSLPALLFFLDEIALLADVMHLRSFSFESGAIRLGDFSKTVDAIGAEGIFGIIFGFSDFSLLDNSYLEIITYGGFALLSVFILTQALTIYILVKMRYFFLLLIYFQLCVAMFTTNIPRLWPTGYIYWAIIGVAFLQAGQKSRQYKRFSYA
jgi:hypothetical protein